MAKWFQKRICLKMLTEDKQTWDAEVIGILIAFSSGELGIICYIFNINADEYVRTKVNTFTIYRGVWGPKHFIKIKRNAGFSFKTRFFKCIFTYLQSSLNSKTMRLLPRLMKIITSAP